MDDRAARFGARIRRERKRQGLTGAQVCIRARLAGHDALVRIEKARTVPGVFRAAAVARALGLSLDALLADPRCDACDDSPPAGLLCGDCGVRGTAP